MENGRQKKPPVNINEIKKEQGTEKHEKGEIKYLGGNREGGPQVGTKQKVNLTQLALGVGLSVLLAFLIMSFNFASKDDALTLLDNQRLLESNQVELEGDLAAESGRIENIIATQADYAKKSDLSGFASKSDLTGLSNTIGSLGSVVTSLGDDYEDLDTRVSELEENGVAYNSTHTIGSSFDYYLDGNELNVRVERDGIYRFRFTLIDKDLDGEGFIGEDVLVYYTDSHELAGGEWEEGDLDNILDALKEDVDENAKLSDYDIYVEILVGNAEEVEDGKPSW